MSRNQNRRGFVDLSALSAVTMLFPVLRELRPLGDGTIYLIEALAAASESVNHLSKPTYMETNHRRHLTILWRLALGGLILSPWLVTALGQQTDVFIIRATVNINATDVYHYNNSGKSGSTVQDRSDDFVFLFEGSETWRLVDNKWKTTESSLYKRVLRVSL